MPQSKTVEISSGSKATGSVEVRAKWPLFAVLLIWIAAVVLGFVRYRPPVPQPPDVDPAVFSAGRAEKIFAQLLSDDIPRPAGSPANIQMRDRITQLLRDFGYEPTLQTAQTYSRNQRYDPNRQLTISNIVAVLKGKTDKPPIMLSAHFDSHPAAPGACDDGVGCAVLLEIARMLSQEDRLERDVVFLITDGEEYGLLGSNQFVKHHKLADRVSVVVNLEARGSTGPSLMFETSDDSLWLVRQFARASKRPFTSSLFYEIYKQLPRQTDFTEFKQHGMQGYNFAFIGDVKNYHTATDNFQNADRGSMQHHGDQALGLIHLLANLDVESQTTGKAVYFDLFGWTVVYWPEHYSMVMAIAALALILITTCLGRYASIKSGVMSFVITILSFGILLGIGWLINFGLERDGAMENRFPDNPLPVELTFWLFGLVAILSISFAFQRWISARHSWFGCWLIWGTLCLATSWFFTGGSYLFVLPALFAGLAGVVSVVLKSQWASAFAMVIPAAVAGILWLPSEQIFYDAVGFSMNLILIFRVAILLVCLLPVAFAMTGRAKTYLLGVGIVIATVTTLWATLAN